jgi:nickel superoxide dismutase
MRLAPLTGIFAALFAMVLSVPTVRAHCQIPCGIYDDGARFTLMLEHVTTIEKSMNQIIKLDGEKTPDWNQLVRWVDNKEDHAGELSEIVTFYFMAQRIKPPKEDAGAEVLARYDRELELLHRILVRTMKARQTTDLAHVEALRMLIGQFRNSYLGEQG